MTYKVVVRANQDWNEQRTYYVKAKEITSAITKAIKKTKGDSIFIDCRYHPYCSSAELDNVDILA